MNLLTIALKNIRQRKLASSLTTLSVALGVMLTVATMVLSGMVRNAFSQNSVGYDVIVGAKGSPVNLVLSSVYRVGQPAESLPYLYYKELEQHPDVTLAVPIATSDTTDKGNFPILATIPKFFELTYAPGKNFRLTTDSKPMVNKWDAIIGSEVAKTNGWGVGSTFKLIHSGTDDHVHNEEFTIVGVLGTTGTPNDRTAFVNINGFFMLDDHGKSVPEARKRWVEFFGMERLEEFNKKVKRYEDHMKEDAAGGHEGHHHHHSMPDVMKELSAVFILTETNPNDPEGMALAAHSTSGLIASINDGFQALAVNPIPVMDELNRKFVGPIEYTLLVMTGLIIIVSGVSIFVSIYNSMADRRRDIAIMRALGAGRTTVFSIILLESVVLCLAGGLIGAVLGHGLIFATTPIIEAKTKLLLDPMSFEPAELIVLPVMIVLASLVGFIPGMTAYRTDVAASLAE